MKIRPIHQDDIPAVLELMELGAPYVRARTSSDYWLYANLFSTTCPVADDNGQLLGAIIAFRSQDHPENLYIQDVITDPDHRRQGISTALLQAVRDTGRRFGCQRLYLTSEPDNTAAHDTWTHMGFVNIPGDHTVNGVEIISDYKGAGKHRAVYELRLHDIAEV
ncbi:N-acetyltransferase [Actinopolyspora erythraea]|uniref:Acetyltransferase n=1 Tax=Actinopolyspora erythraea TaxID=414996 RepID=A0A099D3I7_9ACTN|nr:GNAT family N-acetyltransferase [Actinopolyspora erythraea]ASU79142.1 N-acetyltransferase [Actinopolyspora erythraea]KGI80584.1 acetyltransferase [Actinopolyspora erythraea]